jgi:hypothetical protein
MSDNIGGKVVVITGASSGMGEATARFLSLAILPCKPNLLLRLRCRIWQKSLSQCHRL